MSLFNNYNYAIYCDEKNNRIVSQYSFGTKTWTDIDYCTSPIAISMYWPKKFMMPVIIDKD